jgi:hypothetical protein
VSFTGFLLTVVIGGGVLLVLATVLKPVAWLLGVLFKSPGGWALIVAAVVVFLIASGGFLSGVR